MRQMLRGYVALGAGLAEMARQRLVEASRTLTEENDVDLERLVAATEPVLRQVQDTAAWLLARSRANREIVTQMVREEVERSATALGLVRVEEIDDLEDRIDELERSIAELRAGPSGPSAEPGSGPAAQRTAGKTASARPSSGSASATKKVGAKKAGAKVAAAKTTAPKKTAAAKTAATRPTTGRPS